MTVATQTSNKITEPAWDAGSHSSVRPTAGSTPISQTAVSALRKRIRGAVLTAADEGYDAARQVWNAMIDRKPGVIARCADASDVQTVVDFARDLNALLSVRGGGHNIAGSAVCDGGMVIDLSLMKSVQVDPVGRTARVAPGVTLGELDRETQAFGLVTPTGINSTTGIAGLTLGGGFGWISRKFGLTIDNLVSADVVTADGRLVKASEKDNADLFWALRGGGGNFGVVTSFEFALHPLGPEVMSGLIVYPLTQARDLIRRYRDIAAASPDELACWFVMRAAPPLPFLPKEVHGTGIIVFAACYAGPMDAAERAMKPLRGDGQTDRRRHRAPSLQRLADNASIRFSRRVRGTTGSHTRSPPSRTASSTFLSSTPASCRRRKPSWPLCSSAVRSIACRRKRRPIRTGMLPS